jgi:phenylacetate-coenzyme A ligase PaaK-like adenylate-forming protein
MSIPFHILTVLQAAGALQKQGNSHPMYGNTHFQVADARPIKSMAAERADTTQTTEDLLEQLNIPFLEKTLLYDKIIDLYRENNPLLLKSIYISPTGGTSGTSLFFPTDVYENRAQRRYMGCLASICGTLDSGDVVAILHGGRPMYRSQDVTSEISENAGASVLWIGSDATDSDAFSIIERFHGNTICATPTRLLQFAQYLANNKPGQISLKKIVFTSEPLPASQEEYLRTQFGTTHVASMYGSAEAGVWAASLPTKAIGSTTREFIYDTRFMCVEIWNFDENSTLTEEEMESGVLGEVVLTSLMRRRNPLIRYRTGDVARTISLSPSETTILEERIKEASCEPASPRMLQTQTWETNIFETLNLPPFEVKYMRKLVLGGRDLSKSFHFHGDYVDANVLESIFSTFPSEYCPGVSIIAWQVIVQHGTVEDVCEYRLVPSSAPPPDFEQAMHVRLCKAMELDGDARAENLVTVRVCTLQQLEKGSMAGKTRKIIDKRK